MTTTAKEERITTIQMCAEALHKKRQEFEAAKKARTAALKEVDEETEYSQLKDTVSSLDFRLRQFLIEYHEDFDGEPIGAMKCNVRNAIVYDAAYALDFAKEHGIFLALDQKAFERYVKHVDVPWFVTIEGKLSPQIPTNLEPTLKKLEEEEK